MIDECEVLNAEWEDEMINAQCRMLNKSPSKNTPNAKECGK